MPFGCTNLCRRSFGSSRNPLPEGTRDETQRPFAGGFIVPSALLLGLRSKLYPRNMPRMLNKDLTCFMPSLSRVRQNRASKTKALLGE